jgi:hypothetical protein
MARLKTIAKASMVLRNRILGIRVLGISVLSRFAVWFTVTDAIAFLV